MTRRPAAREGTVYQDKASGRWFVQATLPGGGRKTVSAGTQRDAMAKLAELRQAIASGAPIPSERLALAEHLDTWLRDVVAPSVRPSVAVRYESNGRLHLIPALGRKPLSRLSVADVHGMVARMSRQVSPRTGRVVAPRTVNQILATLHNALQVALEQGLVTRNVADPVQGREG